MVSGDLWAVELKGDSQLKSELFRVVAKESAPQKRSSESPKFSEVSLSNDYLPGTTKVITALTQSKRSKATLTKSTTSHVFKHYRDYAKPDHYDPKTEEPQLTTTEKQIVSALSVQSCSCQWPADRFVRA